MFITDDLITNEELQEISKAVKVGKLSGKISNKQWNVKIMDDTFENVAKLIAAGEVETDTFILSLIEDANTVYLVYGSYKGGRFKAMDINAGVQVSNLIYATMFYPESLDKLKVELKKIEKDNPDWKFELRKAG